MVAEKLHGIAFAVHCIPDEQSREQTTATRKQWVVTRAIRDLRLVAAGSEDQAWCDREDYHGRWGCQNFYGVCRGWLSFRVRAMCCLDCWLTAIVRER